jgi:hypothetical protein
VLFIEPEMTIHLSHIIGCTYDVKREIQSVLEKNVDFSQMMIIVKQEIVQLLLPLYLRRTTYNKLETMTQTSVLQACLLPYFCCLLFNHVYVMPLVLSRKIYHDFDKLMR